MLPKREMRDHLTRRSQFRGRMKENSSDWEMIYSPEACETFI